MHEVALAILEKIVQLLGDIVKVILWIMQNLGH